MNCQYTDRYFNAKVDEQAWREHLQGCASCAARSQKIDALINLLDEPVDFPEGLADRLLGQTDAASLPEKVRRIDLTKYLQLAAVVAVGIFLGVLLGSRANPLIFLSKKEKKEKALIEYRESHHLNDPCSIYSF